MMALGNFRHNDKWMSYDEVKGNTLLSAAESATPLQNEFQTLDELSRRSDL